MPISMMNQNKLPQRVVLANLLVVILHLLRALAPAQAITVAGTTTGHLEISTAPSAPITATEPSFGFFYRLEWNVGGTKQSYFWPSSTITQPDVLDLPNGNYQLTVYQSRKGGPIKTGTKNLTVSGSALSSYPTIALGTSGLKLFNSWNVSTYEFPANTAPNPDHHTIIPKTIPDEEIPWVFITLVRKNWLDDNPVRISCPAYLSYEGAIMENCMLGTGCTTSMNLNITPYISSGQTFLNIQKAPGPIPQQVDIHLLFRKNPTYIPSVYPDDVSFGVNYTSTIPGDTATVDTAFTFAVKTLPHDPNRLEVDKDELCACGTDEYLTYRIDFQNDGAAPTNSVTVTLFNTTHLLDNTIQYQSNTGDWNAPISQSLNPRQFTIDYLWMGGLPGLKQNTNSNPKPNPDECSDHFYVKIKKTDCLPAGTLIQPKAEIKFEGALETIFTNLDETMIVNEANCKSCPPNPRCPNCGKKKKCWLLNLFRKKK